MKRALDLWKNKSNDRFLYFGCPTIDEVIGGVPCVGICEINGAAGSGKSQICMSLAVETSMRYSKSDDIQNRVAYITCGEGIFPIKRLQQIVSHRRKTVDSSKDISLSDDNDILGSILIQSCYNINDLESSLFDGIPKLCRSSPIKLIIIDSIAGALATEYDTTNSHHMYQRTAFLFKLSTQLKWLADTFNIAVVVVNQVRGSGFSSSSTSHYDSKLSTAPALGLAWSHCINSRITLSRRSSYQLSLSSSDTSAITSSKHDDHTSINDENIENSSINSSSTSSPISHKPQRIMQLELSPWRSNASCHFDIMISGIEDVNKEVKSL